MKSAILLLLTSAVLIASERFFLFDVRGDVIATDVLADVDGFPVEYVFQASSERFAVLLWLLLSFVSFVNSNLKSKACMHRPYYKQKEGKELTSKAR